MDDDDVAGLGVKITIGVIAANSAPLVGTGGVVAGVGVRPSRVGGVVGSIGSCKGTFRPGSSAHRTIPEVVFVPLADAGSTDVAGVSQ